MNKIYNLVLFEKLLLQFGNIKRVVHVYKSERYENDVEHSYRLAMLAFYIYSVNDLNLDLELLIKYALVHDLVEVYAGDTYIYTKDQQLLKSKEKRENKALIRIEKEFKEFPELVTLIRKYQFRDNDESKFIYALDKLEPIMSIYINKGYTWKKEKITLEQILESKNSKIAVSNEVNLYYKQLVEILQKNKKEIFYIYDK